MSKPGRLSQPVYWRGRQWAVTRYGLECLTERYTLDKRDILASPNPLRPDHPGSIAHMREKEWVDIHDFIEALTFAVTSGVWRKKAKA